MRKKCIAGLVCCFGFMAVLSVLLYACNSNQDPGKNAERVNIYQSGSAYGGQIVDLGLADGEKALDILAEEDGYRMLVGKSISSETPFPQEDGTTLYFLSGTIHQTEYRFLNEDLTPSGNPVLLVTYVEIWFVLWIGVMKSLQHRGLIFEVASALISRLYALYLKEISLS